MKRKIAFNKLFNLFIIVGVINKTAQEELSF